MKLDVHVAIVGGGPAGTSTALSLLRERPDLAPHVIVLEKARYPRDKPCAGALGRRGDELLADLGVSVDVESAPVDGIAFAAASGAASASPGDIGRVVRRIDFDHALAKHVASLGVAVREDAFVTDVRDEGPRGVVVRTGDGDLRAAVVVGCDGVGSVVRRSMGVGRGRRRAQAVEVDTERLPGEDETTLRFDARDASLTGYAWDFPTVVAGRPMVSRGVYCLKDGAVSDAPAARDVADVLVERLRGLGLDPSRYPTKRYAERGYEPDVPLGRGGCMLVGEAAGIDALTGEGIAQAIEYGVLAGRFLAPRMSGGPVDTGDWNRAMRGSRLARDLRFRARFVPLFYGPRRPALERFFVESPSGLAVGSRHFAGRPQDWIEVGGVSMRGLAHAASAAIRGWLAR